LTARLPPRNTDAGLLTLRSDAVAHTS